VGALAAANLERRQSYADALFETFHAALALRSGGKSDGIRFAA
jgi:hypothetical protein